MALVAISSRTTATFCIMLLVVHYSVGGPRVWINGSGSSDALESVLQRAGFWSKPISKAYQIQAYSTSNRKNPLYLEVGQYIPSGDYFLAATTLDEGIGRVCLFTIFDSNTTTNNVENIKVIGEKFSSIEDSDEAVWKHARAFRKIRSNTDRIMNAPIQNIKKTELQCNLNLKKFWSKDILHTFAVYNDPLNGGFKFFAYATVENPKTGEYFCAMIPGEKKSSEWEAEENFWNNLQSVYEFIWIEISLIYLEHTKEVHNALVTAVKAVSKWVSKIETFEIRLDVRTIFTRRIHYIGEFRRGTESKAFFFVRAKSGRITNVGDESTPYEAVKSSYSVST